VCVVGSTETDALRSVVAKLRPRRLTDACPLGGVFSLRYDAAGASNVSWKWLVPAMAATVRTDFQSFPYPALSLQSSEVAEAQAVSVHVNVPRRAEVV
jgi:hypothetical protein